MLNKKFMITLLTAGTLAITMTGCGNKTDSGSESETASAETTTSAETTATEETTETTTENATEPETEQETEPVDEKDEELAFFDDLIQKTISAYQNKQPEEYLKYTTDEICLDMQKDNPVLLNYGIDYSTHEKIVEDVTISINENRFTSLPDYFFLGTDFKSEYIVKQSEIEVEMPYLLEQYFVDKYSDTEYVASGQVFEDHKFEDVVIVYGTFTGESNGDTFTKHVYVAKVDGEWLVDPAFYPALEKDTKLGLTEDVLGANKYEIGADGHYIVK